MNIPNIKNYTKKELYNWLKYEAGVAHPTHFGNAFCGNLELMQVPEEYVELLWYLKSKKLKTYLNIGIGKGSSFVIETYLQDTLIKSVAIDNTSYWKQYQQTEISKSIEWIKTNSNTDIVYHNLNSSNYLTNCKDTYDAIFIDGDHSYNGVYQDYKGCIKLLNEGGFLIFHDINSSISPGVTKLWNEIKNENCIEFITLDVCGIGIWFPTAKSLKLNLI
jgi:SAM-dependent methyltransferase